MTAGAKETNFGIPAFSGKTPQAAQEEILEILRDLDSGTIIGPKGKALDITSRQFLQQYEFACGYFKFNKMRKDMVTAVTVINGEAKIDRDSVHRFHNMLDEVNRALDQFISGAIPDDNGIKAHCGQNKADYMSDKQQITYPNFSSASKQKQAEEKLKGQLNETATAIKSQLNRVKDIANGVPGMQEVFPGLRNMLQTERDMNEKDASKRVNPQVPNRSQFNASYNDLVRKTVSAQIEEADGIAIPTIEEARKKSAINIGNRISESAYRMQVILRERGLLNRWSGEIYESSQLDNAMMNINANTKLFDENGVVYPQGVMDLTQNITTVERLLDVTTPLVPELKKHGRDDLIKGELEFLNRFVDEAQKQMGKATFLPKEKEPLGKNDAQKIEKGGKKKSGMKSEPASAPEGAPGNPPSAAPGTPKSDPKSSKSGGKDNSMSALVDPSEFKGLAVAAVDDTRVGAVEDQKSVFARAREMWSKLGASDAVTPEDANTPAAGSIPKLADARIVKKPGGGNIAGAA